MLGDRPVELPESGKMAQMERKFQREFTGGRMAGHAFDETSCALVCVCVCARRGPSHVEDAGRLAKTMLKVTELRRSDLVHVARIVPRGTTGPQREVSAWSTSGL